MHIVITDGRSLNPGDLSWDAFSKYGTFEVYNFTSEEELIQRAEKADILIVNKTEIRAHHLPLLPQLKCICVTATGTNNIDIDDAEKAGVKVLNVKGYSSPAVAQHVIALMLHLTNDVSAHNASVHNNEWQKQNIFSYRLMPIPELKDKTLGILGFGDIGQKLAHIALAFEMKVMASHRHPKRDTMKGVEFVDWDTVLKQSDFISLHAPLNESTFEIINSKSLQKMKPSAILINTARGGLVNEEDLKQALLNGIIKAAAVDVLSSEPPQDDNPLLGVENCIITPHHAWASVEARMRLMELTLENIESYIES